MLHSVFNTLIDRDPTLFKGDNPLSKFKYLNTSSKKHASYSELQLQQLKTALLKDNQPKLLLFIQFMYFTLARPYEEIRLLKVGDIKMKDRKIFFAAENDKNSTDSYVGISNSFYKIITDSGILAYPESYYIFSRDKLLPGVTPVGNNYFYLHIKPYIVSLGFLRLNKDHTIYSFKHTGAIALYKATRDIKLVQAQCRHSNIEQTNKYLRNLGVLDDFEQLNKWESPI
jgi:integrase